MIQDVIAKRLVVHLGGYDPMSVEGAHRRFAREARRFEKTWSVRAEITDPVVTADQATWRIESSGPNWRVETDFRLLRWDDIVAAAEHESMWRRLPRGLLALLDFIGGGALFGYCRTNWRYAAFFLFPLILLIAFAAASAYAGLVAARLAGSAPLGILIGLAAFALLLRFGGRKFSLAQLLDDWIFSHDYVRGEHPVLGPRLDRVAQALATAARAGEVDEILVIGHSIGAVLALDLVDRTLRLDPEFGQHGPRAAVLTVGSSVLKIGLHRGARRFHAAVERVVGSGVLWAEYQALTDIMNFYKTDPVAEMRLTTDRRPVVRIVRISRMIDPAIYREIKRSFYRVHCRFVSGNDLRALYDYFMLVCGPLPIERQVRSEDGAISAIGPDGSLVEAFPHVRPEIDRMPETALR